MIDLRSLEESQRLAGLIKADVDAFSMTFDDGPRRHLGASLIGAPCTRFLWYGFRWMYYTVHEPRMLRLFQRGHREESWLWSMLRWAGWTVYDADPATGQQWRVSAVEGHFGGSLDAIGMPPARYGFQEWMLLECKTNKDGDASKNWKQLIKDGMKTGKPLHWSQSAVYGYMKQLRMGVYFNSNKDNDDIYINPFVVDNELAKRELQKAQFVILSQTAPPKLHINPSMKECKYCDARQVCHFNAKPLVNCRSCQFAQPISGKQWQCNYWNQTLTDAIILTGCQQWRELIQ